MVLLLTGTPVAAALCAFGPVLTDGVFSMVSPAFAGHELGTPQLTLTDS